MLCNKIEYYTQVARSTILYQVPFSCRYTNKTSSEKTTTPSPNKGQTATAKSNNTKQPQEWKSVAKTGEEKGASSRTRKKKTNEEAKDTKIAKEEVTDEKEECQQKYAVTVCSNIVIRETMHTYTWIQYICADRCRIITYNMNVSVPIWCACSHVAKCLQ